MRDLVQLLHADHSNAVRVLRLLEKELGVLKRHFTADLLLMRQVMGYMRQYAELVHHPREDVLFARLATRVTRLRAQLDTLGSEHRVLAAKAQRFFDELQEVAEAPRARADVVRLGGEYVTTLERHMRFEEEEILPVARERLTRADWNDLASAVPGHADPVFGGQVADEFILLYKVLHAGPRH